MFSLFLKIRPFIKDFLILLGLIKSLVTGEYSGVSGKTVMALIIGFVYLVSPIDFIPDFFSIFGFVDDITVIGLITYLVKEDLEKYRQWKAGYNHKKN